MYLVLAIIPNYILIKIFYLAQILFPDHPPAIRERPGELDMSSSPLRQSSVPAGRHRGEGGHEGHQCETSGQYQTLQVKR